MQSFGNGCGFKYQLTRLNTPDLPLLMSERRDFWWAFGKPHTSIPFGLLGIWNLLHHPHVKGHACKSFHLFCCTKKKEKKKARVDWGSNCWRAKRTKKMKSIGYEKRKKQKKAFFLPRLLLLPPPLPPHSSPVPFRAFWTFRFAIRRLSLLRLTLTSHYCGGQ